MCPWVLVLKEGDADIMQKRLTEHLLSRRNWRNPWDLPHNVPWHWASLVPWGQSWNTFPTERNRASWRKADLGCVWGGGSVMGLGILSHQIAVEANNVTGVSRGLRSWCEEIPISSKQGRSDFRRDAGFHGLKSIK